jgi:hypothetical protein
LERTLVASRAFVIGCRTVKNKDMTFNVALKRYRNAENFTVTSKHIMAKEERHKGPKEGLQSIEAEKAMTIDETGAVVNANRTKTCR